MFVRCLFPILVILKLELCLYTNICQQITEYFVQFRIPYNCKTRWEPFQLLFVPNSGRLKTRTLCLYKNICQKTIEHFVHFRIPYNCKTRWETFHLLFNLMLAKGYGDMTHLIELAVCSGGINIFLF